MRIKKDDVVEFQLPVHDDVLFGKGDIISVRSKIHIYVNGKSLCGKYYMVPKQYETTDIGKEALFPHPEYFCKVCRQRYLRG